MKIKLSRIHSMIIYFIVFYMLNKNLWDYFFGSLVKNIYYALIVVFGIIEIIRLSINKKYRFPTICFILYAIVILVNGYILSNTEQRQVGYMEYLIYPMCFFALLYFEKTHFNYSNLIHKLMIWGGVTSFLAMYEYISKKPILSTGSTRIYTYYDGTSSYRAGVFIGSPMILAIVLGVMLVIAFYFYHFEKKKRYLFLIVLLLLGIIFTGSRAPLISAIAGILLMYYSFSKYNKAGRKTQISLMIGFFVSVLFLLFLSIAPDFSTGITFVDNTISRFSSVFNFSSEWGNKERLLRWAYYINVFKHNCLTGIGIATTSAEVQTNINVTAHGITTESGILARLVETGIIGTLPYYFFFLGFSILALKEMRKYIKCGFNEYFVVVGILCLFLIEDIVLQISLDIFGTFIIYLIIALAIGIGKEYSIEVT